MRTTRIVLVIAGIALMAFAAVGILTSPDIKLIRQAPFLIGTLLLNDAVLAPVFIGVGIVVSRVLPPRWRAPVHGALIVTAAVTVVAFPFLLGFGRRADLPSALPRNYLGGYAVILGMIWFATATVIVWRELHPTHRNRSTSD